MLWLLASESADGIFDADIDRLAFRLRTDRTELATALKHLIDKGFFLVMQSDSNALADCQQSAVPETETETETETPAKAVGFVFKRELLNLGADPALVADWLAVRKTKKASNTQTALDAFVREVKKAGYTVDQALRICCAKSWKGFDADWVKDIKPVEAAPAIPFDRDAYEAKRKAQLAADREAYMARERAATVPARAVK